MEVKPTDDFTLQKAISSEMKLHEHIPLIEKVGEKASKEYQIETALDKMQAEWEGVEFDCMSYRDTGTWILRGSDIIINMLDEHRVMTQVFFFYCFLFFCFLLLLCFISCSSNYIYKYRYRYIYMYYTCMYI